MVSRRNFLSGRFSPTGSVRRPPWHTAEADFNLLCTRCTDCLDACPTRIIVTGEGGFPEVSFATGECTFCGDCARVCRTGALAYRAEAAPWALRAEIGDKCLTYGQTICRSCGEACATQAIRFSPVLGGAPVPILDIDACTGCGACVAVCPARTISVSDPWARPAPHQRKIA